MAISAIPLYIRNGPHVQNFSFMYNNIEIGALIPIENRNGQQAVNARNLYEWLGIKKDFTDWMKAQVKRCDLTENQDFEVFPQKGVNPSGGRPSSDYALSLNAAKEISMMSQTEKGKQARRYFIECERVAKMMERTATPAIPNFENPAEAARAWAMEYERNTQLKLENKTLQDDLNTQLNINSMLQGEVDAMQPKVRIYDQVINSPEEANAPLSTTSSVANEIGMSGQKLNKMLIACGIIYKAQDGDYLFTADYIGWGLGRSVSKLVNEAKGIVRTYIKWNTRGRAYIHALNDTNWDKRRAWHLLRTGKEVAAV